VKPRLLDLFCCEGGASQGYADAGFDVTGIDIAPQLRYPFRFELGDAADWPLDGFDAVHASPPCEDHSVTMGFGMADRGTGWLLPHTIARLRAWGGPFVVENVEARAVKAHMPGAIRLCGSAFGLGAHDSRGRWRILRRHRLFLTSFPVADAPCTCRGKLVGGIYGHGEQGVNGGRGYGFAADAAREALGMPWASRDGCAEAIPPAYTRFLGERLLAHLLKDGAKFRAQRLARRVRRA
jgi:DNA (cytosine-5)-methyltransferase 1